MCPLPETIPNPLPMDEDTPSSNLFRPRPPTINTRDTFNSEPFISTMSTVDVSLYSVTASNTIQRTGSGLTTPTHRYMETLVCARETAKFMGKARLRIGVPKNVMIVTKFHDPQLVTKTKEVTLWLIDTLCDHEGASCTVYVDERMQDHLGFGYSDLIAASTLYEQHIMFWTPELCAIQPDLFDVVITLGGDGTVLYTSWLFQKHVPPVIPFHLGSLGFLTVFDFTSYPHLLKHIFYQELIVNTHMRLDCTIYRNPKPQPTSPCHVFDSPDSNVTMTMTPTLSSMVPWKARKEESFQVLNELVVDRGPSAYMGQLELFGDENHLTTVQADGLVVSTPTGSTAYSLSAGGSLVHPQVSALLVTPICPHTLSFRSMLVPDSMDLRICVPPTSRSTAWASFDGRNRVELKQGDFIVVSSSKHPFPTVCRENQSNDWFHSLTRCLKWNERRRQLAFHDANHSCDSN
ncbi:hypothetical protein HMI56_007159 [Coelomomyces lativittatus]|nr:hypothetical protein HMI56_007159 [Coelomomyces lativittatus]